MSTPNRRGFLKRLSALTAGLSAVLLGWTRSSRAVSEPGTSGAQPDAVSVEPKAATIPPEYPRPTYVPPRFALTSTWRDYPGGFSSSDQIVQYFHRDGVFQRNFQMAFLSI